MRILITGATGLLGANLVLMYRDGHEVFASSREKPAFENCNNVKLDITNQGDLKVIEEIMPEVVINCAALTDVDYCEQHQYEAEELNSSAVKNIANTCNKIGARLIHISTDAVFDGEEGNYTEEDKTNPINIYSKTKLNAERAIEEVSRNYCILRTTIYGLNLKDKKSLSEWVLEKLEKKEEIQGFSDIFFSPINVTNLGRVILELCEKRYVGILNVGGSESCSKFHFAREIARVFGYDEALVVSGNSEGHVFKAKRPKNISLNSEKACSILSTKLKNIREGLEEFKNLRTSDYFKELKKQNVVVIDKLNKSSFHKPEMGFSIFGRRIGFDEPTYFIADIAANHDGNLERAKHLIRLAKEAGADAVKFQHHRVKHYVSEKGFISLGSKMSHQSKWKKSIFEVYKDAEVPLDWTSELKKYSEDIGIHLFTTPYDLGMVDLVDPYVPAFKIGSGDINWPDMLEKVAKKGKPVFFSTGASTIGEVQKAVQILTKNNKEIVLMQCNTNYTAEGSNFNYIHLNVLKTYNEMFPDLILGLSDHTKGHATVLGAVSLGARVIEKHFTDDTSRDGPDHPFSMDPKTWREMVDRTRELEKALGNGNKKVEDNEKDTVVLQRRCIRAGRDILEGEVITEKDIEFQRPAPKGSLEPSFKNSVIGKRARKLILREEEIDFSKII